MISTGAEIFRFPHVTCRIIIVNDICRRLVAACDVQEGKSNRP